jgi:RNA polymerase sigma-70 factor (ECF subfamily)
VGDVFADFYAKNGRESDKENFGYLSVACVRQAFRCFKAWRVTAAHTSPFEECLCYMAEGDVVEELINSEDTAAVLASLETLKGIEKAIILGRYYGDLKFSQIAEDFGMNINTVLSRHRRALEKLRPRLSRHFFS